VRWGVGGAIAQKFASEGFFTVVTDAHRVERLGADGGDPRAGGEA